MKLLVFNKVRLDGEDCKIILLGKIAIDVNSIMAFCELEDKFDTVVKNVVMIRDKQGGNVVVNISLDELIEKLEEVDFV